MLANTNPTHRSRVRAKRPNDNRCREGINVSLNIYGDISNVNNKGPFIVCRMQGDNLQVSLRRGGQGPCSQPRQIPARGRKVQTTKRRRGFRSAMEGLIRLEQMRVLLSSGICCVKEKTASWILICKWYRDNSPRC